MLNLTREVRMTIDPLQTQPAPVVSGHCGNPCDHAAYYFAIQVTLTGQPDPSSQYLMNVRTIDQRVRDTAAPLLADLISSGRFTGPRAVEALLGRLGGLWGRVTLESVRLNVNPLLSFQAIDQERPMVRLSQRFEFSAAHRLHNPELSQQQNAEVFGKCNNPAGHGHNYELEVTVRGAVGADGRVITVAELERIVHQTVIERFDHKHLNQQTAEFADTIPTVENLARVIYGLLKQPLQGPDAELAAVRIWETPKTSSEYTE